MRGTVAELQTYFWYISNILKANISDKTYFELYLNGNMFEIYFHNAISALETVRENSYFPEPKFRLG